MRATLTSARQNSAISRRRSVSGAAYCSGLPGVGALDTHGGTSRLGRRLRKGHTADAIIPAMAIASGTQGV